MRPLAFGLLVCSFAAYGQAVGPLVINPIADTNVMPGTKITITVSVTNTAGIAANQLSWTLPSAPTGASIANSSPANTALFAWQPTTAQAPSTNTIIVQVQDLANTTNVTSTSFRVNVFTNAIPTPPFLAPIIDSTIVAGQLFTFTNSAHTTDGTTNALVWSLEDGAPDGASITPDTGVFAWTPTAQQVDVWPISVTVTEQSSTQLSTTESFNLTVILTNNCAGFDDFVAAVEQGGVVPLPDCPIIVLSNTLVIANDVTLDAGSAATVITGNNLTRLFTVLAPATLTLNGLTLSGGRSTNGGAIYVQEGAQALLSNCIFSGNGAIGSDGLSGVNGSTNSGTGGNGTGGSAGGATYGGAIYNAGDVTISVSQFLTNSAHGGDGGAGGTGGDGRFQGGNGGNGGNGGAALGAAVYSIGTVTIDACTFNGNTATAGSGGAGGSSGNGPFNGLPGIGGGAGSASGAAVYNTGEALIMNSTFSSGSATGGNSAAGGTLSNNNGSDGPNGGDGSGGGIFGGAITTVTNCTFFGNSVTGGNGGDGGPANSAFQGGNGGNGGNGLGAGLYGASGTNIVVNCTFALNQANGGTNGVAGSGPFAGKDGSPGAAHGAGVARRTGSFYLQNSILMTNAPGANAYGTITDGGKNLSSDASLSGTSLKNTDPKLNSLAPNGGPTETMALQSSSPAIDAADDAAAPSVDQVGTTRPVGPHSDIGAYEYPTQLAPQIISAPASQTVYIGNNATFTVSATGGTPLAYRWQFNGTQIAGATKTAFTVTNAQPTNAGNYTVSVSNRLGVVVTPQATLTVCEPTSISGYVRDGTNGLPGATVTADANSAITDETGAYTITGVCPGTYFVFASLTGYQFSPAQPVTIPPTASNVNFTVVQPTYTVSGRVTAGGAGVSGVRIFGGLATDANGYYSLSLAAGTYTNTPLKPGFGYTFQPPSRVITVPPTQTNQDYTAGWKISSLVLQTDGTIQFQVIGTGNLRVEASSNFLNWVTLSNHNGSYLFIDHSAGSVPRRFYRVSQP